VQSSFFLGWSTQGGLFFGVNFMKYIIYCRKSTESEDRQILSLPAQKREAQEYAKKNKLEVVDLLAESASAYKIGRLKFNEMIQRIQDGEADGIIVWSLTRIARNALDGGMIIHLMDTGVLKEIRTPSNLIKNDGSAKFMLQIEFAMSKKTSDDNSKSVKRGNREKILRGWYYKKHAGYMFYEDEKYGWEKTLVPDPERFDLFKKP
jgi:DNA invertase Pin-like site-specific DNA recombinase